MSLTVTPGPLVVKRLVAVKNATDGTVTLTFTMLDKSGTVPEAFYVSMVYGLDADFNVTDSTWTTALNDALASLGFTL